MARFSILIPVYNVEAYLDDCLQSVLAQTLSDFEVVAVDDGSTDGSGDILSRYKTAFAQRDIPYTLIRQENQGLGDARNTALDNATGEYVLFLDSDDQLQPNALEIIDSRLDGEDLLCFNGQRFFEETGIREEPEPMLAEGPLSGWEYYNRHALEPRRFAFVCVVLRCYRRQFLFDEQLSFDSCVYHEDNLFTPLVCQHARKVSVIPDALYVYRVRPGSIMAHRSLRHKKDLITIANNLMWLSEDFGDIDYTVFYRYVTQLYQMAFAESTPDEDPDLLMTVYWPSYRRASRTKLRHRLNYAVMYFWPHLFRKLNRQGHPKRTLNT